MSNWGIKDPQNPLMHGDQSFDLQSFDIKDWLPAIPKTPAFGHSGQFSWSPVAEVFEHEDNLVVRAELPGLRPEDVSIEVVAGSLTIRGERKIDVDPSQIISSQRRYGKFRRSISVPQNLDFDRATANFKDGVLEITLPALEPQQKRQITIALRHPGDPTTDAPPPVRDPGEIGTEAPMPDRPDDDELFSGRR
jgi:HSP20 family protein